MKLSHGLITGLSALVFTQALHAEADEKSKKTFSADAELGAVLISGNTESSSFKGRLDVTQDLKNWKNQFILETLYKKDTLTDEETEEEYEATTAEQYFASLRGDYKLDEEHKALFAYAEYDDKRFSSFEYQYSISAGYTDRLFTKDNSHLSYSIGPGYKVEKPKPIVEDDVEVIQDAEKNFVIALFMEYAYAFSENSKFKQTVNTMLPTESDSNVKTKAVSSITANINSSFAMKASYTIDYNSEVNEDTKHADTTTSVTLVYSF